MPGGAARAARGLGVTTALAVLLQTACAADVARHAGGFRHRSGFEIADPAAWGSGWRPVRVEGAALAYRGPGQATMSWLVGCRRPVAAPSVLARQLLIGLRGRAVTGSGPVSVAGGEGWSQRITASQDGAAVHMKTVTRVLEGCVLDWVLVTPGGIEALEADFDRWWSSLRVGVAS